VRAPVASAFPRGAEETPIVLGRGAHFSDYPRVASLVREGRFDEALAELYAHADRMPDDRAITHAIESVRDVMAETALAELGAQDAAPVKTGAPSPDLGADERYLAGRIDGNRSIAQLLRESTLGRHRTIRALVSLVKDGAVAIPTARARGETARSSAITSVLVAEGNPTHATLTRTMLRVSLGRAVAYHTATSAREAIEIATRERPGLVVLDFRLPGQGDGIETLRSIRALPGSSAVPAAIFVQRVEADFVRSRLPRDAVMLVRPIERATLESMLADLVGHGR
jgi:CheY-like chemotaxis protein